MEYKSIEKPTYFLKDKKSAFEEETKLSFCFYFYVAQDSLELAISDIEFLVPLMLEINPCSKLSIWGALSAYQRVTDKQEVLDPLLPQLAGGVSLSQISMVERRQAG